MGFSSIFSSVLAILTAIGLLVLGIGLFISIGRIHNAPPENRSRVFTEEFSDTIKDLADPFGDLYLIVIAAVITIIMIVFLYVRVSR